MSTLLRRFALATLPVLAVTAALPAATSTAEAGQPYFEMTCDELWYERNAVYDHFGYCFKTERARSVFGTDCHAPWGKLTKSAQKQVNEIKHWEHEKGCN